uniref:Fatty acyl-CoA reductase n=1 Tax=Aceria tosichella TaxID=561515 RepID=A0A6G1SDH4_9ACAR
MQTFEERTGKMGPSMETKNSPNCVTSEVSHEAKLMSQEKSEIPEDIVDFLKSAKDVIDEHKCSEIAAFYEGRSIFITGASGFVGKCLLEKLLRSCRGIKKIYVLLRPKRGVEVKERLEILKKSELFFKVRESKDGQAQLDKIIPIEGDITRPAFGLAEEDINLLSDEISLIFHSAATVKFAEPLNVAVNNNVVSVENLITLASKMKNLEALVHVSTAYSNCNRNQVDEIFYDTPIDANKLIDMANWMNPELLEKLCPLLLGDRPNTYTYTKAVAESLLVEKSKTLLPNVPIAMVRPSIVTGVWRQPIRGWVDNFNGPTGVILSMMTGAIQAMLACPSYCADIVPVDIVANLIICTAWQILEQHKKPEKRLQASSIDQNENISVFNCVSGTLNPVSWKKVAGRMERVVQMYPCEKMMRTPGFLLLSNEYLFNVYNFLNHTIVAYTGDFFLKSIGRKPTLVIIYKRLMKMVQILKPFTTNQWLFKCTNVTTLYDRLSTVDKNIFNFDVRQVVWNDYLDRYYIGAKIYAMKDDPNTVSSARHRLKRMNNLNTIARIMLMLIAYYFLLSGTSAEKYVIQSFSQLFSFDFMMFNERSGIATRALDSSDMHGVVFKNEIG